MGKVGNDSKEKGSVVLRCPTHAVPDWLGKAMVRLLLRMVHRHLRIMRCLMVRGRRREPMVVLVVLLRLLIELRPAVGNTTHAARVRAHRRHLLCCLPSPVDGAFGRVRFVLDLVAFASSLDAFVAVLVHHEVVCEQFLIILTESIILSPVGQPESDLLQGFFVESVNVVLCQAKPIS